MADPRFFQRVGPFTLAAIAQHTGATLHSSCAVDAMMEDVASLEMAGAQQVSFFDNVKYVEAFQSSNAAACFVRPKYIEKAPTGMALLVTDTPYAAYAMAAQMFYPHTDALGGISPHAVVDSTATIGQNVTIAPYAVIGAGVVIGDGCVIGAHCVISHAMLGARVRLHPGVKIGQDGFGFAPTPQGLLKVPQLGRVIIGDDVEIGANACIDRGAGPDTVIGNGVKIDNLVQIGHNCTIGDHAVIVAQVGVSGSTRLGRGVMLGGQSGVAGHLTLGDGVQVAAQSGVMHDVPAGVKMGGSPALPVLQWHRQTAALARLIQRKKERADG